jgi:hypothetical protein
MAVASAASEVQPPRRTKLAGGRGVVVLVALALALAVAVAGAPVPPGLVLHSIEPSGGEEMGGQAVTLRGTGLPMFAREALVYVNRDQPCTNVTVITPFRALRCVVPPCGKCGTVDVVVRAAGATSNPVRFTYHATCYDPVRPRLAERFSAAENCTVCQHVVGIAQAVAGDVTSHQGIREALRDVCASHAMRSFAPVRTGYCRVDLSAACGVLFSTFGTALADAMWAGWDAGAMYGALPDLACAAIGRCPRV